MQKLTKAVFLSDRLLDCVALLDLTKLEEAINTYNNKRLEMFEDLRAAIEAFNEVAQEAEAWREDMVSAMETYRDDKSDKWQEGESGERYAEWMSHFEDFSIDDLRADEEPEEFEMPQEAEDLKENFTSDNLPDAPGE